MNIGDQIKEARKEKGWTQEKLAAELNVSRSAVLNWERGVRNPEKEMLLRISKVLGIQPDKSAEDMPEIPEIAATPEESAGEQEAQEYLKEEIGSGIPAKSAEYGSEIPAKSEMQRAEISAKVAEQPAESGNAVVSSAEKQPEKKTSSRKLLYAIIAGLACIALLVWLVIIPALQPKEQKKPYLSEDGKTYTIESMQQQAENADSFWKTIVNSRKTFAGFRFTVNTGTQGRIRMELRKDLTVMSLGFPTPFWSFVLFQKRMSRIMVM